MNPNTYVRVYNVCTNIKSHHDTSICTCMYIPYSGNYFAGENFREWLAFVYFTNKIFADGHYISHTPWIGTSKHKQSWRAHAIFANNIFANWDRFAKFAKIFSHKINLLYTVVNPTDRIGHMTDRIGHMADRIGHMTDRIGHMTDRIGHMADRIGHMADRIGHMTDRIGHMADRIGHMADRIGHMADRIGHMTDRIGHMTDKIGHMTRECINPVSIGVTDSRTKQIITLHM